MGLKSTLLWVCGILLPNTSILSRRRVQINVCTFLFQTTLNFREKLLLLLFLLLLLSRVKTIHTLVRSRVALALRAKKNPLPPLRFYLKCFLKPRRSHRRLCSPRNHHHRRQNRPSRNHRRRRRRDGSSSEEFQRQIHLPPPRKRDGNP